MVAGDKRYFNTDCAFYYEYCTEYNNVPSCLFRYEHSTTHETDDIHGCKACPHWCPAYVKRNTLIDNAIAEKMKNVAADYDFVAAEKEALGEVDISDEALNLLLDKVDLLMRNVLGATREELSEKIQEKIYEALKGAD